MAVTRSSHARASEMTCNKPNASPRRMRKQKTKSSPLIADTKAQAVTKTSRFFQVVAPLPVQKPARPVSNFRFGLVQEEIQGNLYYLLVQSVLWCQTWGKSARPVLDTILSLYPTPEKLAQAKLPELTLIIYPIGLHNIRAKRLIDLAKMWLAAPPCKERRYRKVGYPGKGSGKNVKPGEVLEEVCVGQTSPRGNRQPRLMLFNSQTLGKAGRLRIFQASGRMPLTATGYFTETGCAGCKGTSNPSGKGLSPQIKSFALGSFGNGSLKASITTYTPVPRKFLQNRPVLQAIPKSQKRARHDVSFKI